MNKTTDIRTAQNKIRTVSDCELKDLVGAGAGFGILYTIGSIFTFGILPLIDLASASRNIDASAAAASYSKYTS